MKNALLAILIILCFSSCYRERPVPDKRAILTKHKWYLKSKSYDNVWINSECAVMQELTFNKNCTGEFNNATCDHFAGIAPFEWYLSSNTLYIHFRKLDTKREFARFVVSSVYDDELTVHGTYEGHPVYAIYKNVKQEP